MMSQLPPTRSPWTLALALALPLLALLASAEEDCFVSEEQFRYCCCGGMTQAAQCWPAKDLKAMKPRCCDHLASACGPESKPEEPAATTTQTASDAGAGTSTAKGKGKKAKADGKGKQKAKVEAQAPVRTAGGSASSAGARRTAGTTSTLPSKSESVAPTGVPTLKLLGGGAMPMSGIGLCCRPSASGDAVRQAVKEYLLMGGRHLDDAQIYNNHAEVGQGLREALAEGVPRNEVFLTTKIWPSDFGFESALAWVDSALAELGVDYIDLALLHAAGVPDDLKCRKPKACRQETWLALQRAQEEGKIRNLGVSNFGPRQMEELMALGGSPITANQIEFHPWAPRLHLDTAAWCHRRGIAVTAYGSVGSSGLAEQMMMQDALKEIADKHRKTVGQVLLRWAVQQNVSVIPGTSNPKHMAENLRVFDFTLSREEMAALDGIPDEHRMLHFGHNPDEKP